jgi:hypothetical protein
VFLSFSPFAIGDFSSKQRRRAMPSKKFPTADALSAITGRLVSDAGMDRVYEVLDWMAGEKLFTHQLPRVMREARALMIVKDPRLVQVCEESKQVDRNNWREWLATWTTRLGPTLDVHKFSVSTHERIDPLSELAEKISPERILIVP